MIVILIINKTTKARNHSGMKASFVPKYGKNVFTSQISKKMKQNYLVIVMVISGGLNSEKPITSILNG